MKQPHDTQPPKWPLRFFQWFCHPDYQEDIEGDLRERFERRVTDQGVEKARQEFWKDVIWLLRPALIRPFTPTSPLTHTAMFPYYFKIGWRNVLRHKSYSLINILGLTLGLTGAILIFTLVTYHLSFDTFHPDAEHIYRVTTELHQDEISYDDCVPQPIGKALRDDYAFAEKIAMIYSRPDWLVSVPASEDDKKYEESIAFAEPEYFDILNFPLIQGDGKAILSEPQTAVITERVARKLFGDQNPMGKMIRIQNKLDFKVSGVLADLPVNTDRKDEIYVSYSSLKDHNEWLAGDSWMALAGGMHCFMLLKPDVLPADVNKAFPELSQKYYNERNAEIFQFKLQPLSDIHFNPDLGGYLAKKNLWALALIGLFLVITACVNFINLATAQATRRAREIGVRKVLGSRWAQLFWQFIAETALKKFGVQSAEEVIGKRLRIGINNSQGTIVGVVKDFHNKSFHETIDPICLTTSTNWYSSCAVKVNPTNWGATLISLEQSWKEVFPNHVFEYEFLDEQIARFYKADNMIFRLVQIFAGIAILIGCLGLYGLVSFMAIQKTKEVGVRKILGASLQSILWLFGKEFTRLLVLAFFIAAPLGWWVMQNWLENFSYQIEIGIGIFALAIAVTFLIAALTVSVQSLRAALANPVDSLRSE